ncbi:MAG: 3-hydroxyacyl-CoA dehydrogenase NAD-binding domain-containing protein [Halieaceae bacterium]|uniref:3-hydroxyacyl-CoA dehydrogenase NAD-binding domain-containing protein n=1 Tax=Haliea alexandrii TaxID=2448162 RepID=UPI000F0B901F|nr:3-hydroxyacyl-CoA dehydrogenase NAD-binding domain-containing protein [Haliea alexandrii]MCR9183990.1 3-hydroxyacyl-CoA dehydrogenase NAD-binding domain-containing protein [Halieaceae bacterium]
MPLNEIKRVCYVGAGTMGCYNALAAAICGYEVALYDVDEATLDQVAQRQSEFAAMFVGGGYCAQEDIAPALARVRICADLGDATAAADLVSESVYERLDVKRAIHRRLDEVCPPGTILTTNSSVLLVSQIEDVVSRGDRFAALHSHLGSPLVDVVPGPRTDAAVIDLLRRYVLSINGVPLVLQKEYPGYVLNALLGPALSTAQALMLDGAAGIEDVDRTWMIDRNAAMGPFGMIDLFGLGVILDSWEDAGRKHHLPALRERAIQFLRSYTEKGKLGMKAGEGFYQYPQPAYQHPDFLHSANPGSPSEVVSGALNVALIGNAVLIAMAGVAQPGEIDRAWKVGTYLDAGPFEILAKLGHESFQAAVEQEVGASRIDRRKAALVLTYLNAEEIGE